MLAPKMGTLLLHLHPGTIAMVICTGSEMIVVHLGPNGEPIEAETSDHMPCIAANPETGLRAALKQWFAAPRSYRHDFVEITHPLASEARLGFLAFVRGPPHWV